MSSLKWKLSAELEKIPGLHKSELEGKNGAFTYFSYKGKEVAHFDNDNELDLRLTKPVIAQLGLCHPSDSRNHPNRAKSGSHWMVLQFRRSNQLNKIIALVKLAIKQL